MMITFKSDSLFLKLGFILSVKGGKFLPKQPTGILRAESTVLPSILIVAIPVRF